MTERKINIKKNEMILRRENEACFDPLPIGSSPLGHILTEERYLMKKGRGHFIKEEFG